jgi:protein-disulfide isomerase-like protein with CxxC motif
MALASEAAGFLKLLTQRGERHGFGKPAHEAIETLAAEIDARITGLCKAAPLAPACAAAIDAQARAIAELCDQLFDDDRSTQLMRRIAAALHASAA